MKVENRELRMLLFILLKKPMSKFRLFVKKSTLIFNSSFLTLNLIKVIGLILIKVTIRKLNFWVMIVAYYGVSSIDRVYECLIYKKIIKIL